MTNDQRPTTIAWFSPLPPVRSGIAAYSAELLPRVGPPFVIESYPERVAHEFAWRMRREPYDLVVYQLGNAPCHDYMWAYMVRYPGLVVVHDARLHQARARRLLDQRRFDDYRDELSFDHPDLTPDFAEYAVAGLGGPLYYFWPMLGVVMRTARAVAVHNARVAAELREAFPETPIETIRMGVPSLLPGPNARMTVRHRLALPDSAVVFAAFGKITAEKRVSTILNALAALTREGRDAYVMLVGDAEGYSTLAAELERHGLANRVRVTGHVEDEAIADHLAAADVCLCLRWPTARETSASWLRCLASGRATVITDLAHLVDTPPSVTIRVDLLNEDASLLDVMRRLTDDAGLRERVARAGHAYWSAHHTLDFMVEDYRRVLVAAISRPTPTAAGLPRHFLDDHSETARRLVQEFGVSVDVFD